MIRALAPFVVATVAVVMFLGPGQVLLPSGLRLQAGGSITASAPPAAHIETRGSGLGLAPKPVVDPPASAARVRVVVRPLEKAEQGYALEAILVAPDGKALTNTPVAFYELVDLFGTREMHLGDATTDGRGSATLGYLPARTGSHQIVARSPRQGAIIASEGRLSFDATVSAPAPRFEPSALATFSDRVPYAVGILVLLVWSLIAFALFGTARGVIGGARDTSRKVDTA
ncbi:MAG TPA: hypothetical protein VFM06_08855 [Candidatus Limnocylindria bacterium]|nr:hypothetical protein [Candidatus Limnocylindria bacterium]